MKMVTVRFIDKVYLPRFNMEKGQEWRLRPDRLTPDGFTLGGGWVESIRYEIIDISGKDKSKKSHEVAV